MKNGAHMTTTTVDRLEIAIARLPLSEQLWLMERLVQRIRRMTQAVVVAQEQDLAAMATDSDIQRELHAINTEFANTELDGLDFVR
jgi:hypothetical protein